MLPKGKKLIIKLFSIVAILFFIFSCAEKEFDPNNAEKSFAIAKEPYDDENYERAVTRLGEFKSRFPYSQYAIEAELLIANSYFEQEQFPEAAAAYEQFVKLHPKHPQLDFAMYRVGDCYWQEAPDSVDKEQEYTEKAVDEWEKLVGKLPQSPHAEKAKKLINEGKRRMAEHYNFIAKFYCKQEVYHACAYRYLQLAETFPQFKDLRINAWKQAADALEKVADAKAEDPTSDKNLYFKRYTVAEIRKRAAEIRKQATGGI